MNGLVQRKVFSVVQRPANRNPLGTTMVYKYKIDRVRNTVTCKCRLSLWGDWQKEDIDLLSTRLSEQSLIMVRIELCIRLQLEWLTNCTCSRLVLLTAFYIAPMILVCVVLFAKDLNNVLISNQIITLPTSTLAIASLTTG